MGKTLKIACQMDPIDRIDIRGGFDVCDPPRGPSPAYEIFYYTPQNLCLHGNRLLAAAPRSTSTTASATIMRFRMPARSIS